MLMPTDAQCQAMLDSLTAAGVFQHPEKAVPPSCLAFTDWQGRYHAHLSVPDQPTREVGGSGWDTAEEAVTAAVRLWLDAHGVKPQNLDQLLLTVTGALKKASEGSGK